MSRFQFRLDRVLRLRTATEEQEAVAMSRAAAHEAERREASERSAAKLDEMNGQIADATNGQALAAGLHGVYGVAAQVARQAVAEDAKALEAAEAARLDALARYHEARTERRTLERLRERAAENWISEEKQREQGTLDEIAIRRSQGKDQT